MMVFVNEATPIAFTYINGIEKKKENHDSRRNETFYKDLKLFALICKFAGIFNLQNVMQNDGRLLKYKLLSFHTLWGPLIVGLATIVNTHFETENFLSYIGIFYIARGISVVLLSSYYDKFLLQLIFNIEELSVIIMPYRNNSSKKKKNVNKHGRLVLYVASVGYIALMCINVTVLSILDDYNLPHIGNKICDSFTFLTRQLLVLMYMYFCYNIKLILRSISSIWRRSVKKIITNNSGDTIPPEETLEKIRLLHADVINTMEYINEAYGLRLLFYVTIYCLEVLLSLYEFSNRHVHFKLYFIIYSGLTLYMVTKFTEDITIQVSIEFRKLEMISIKFKQCSLIELVVFFCNPEKGSSSLLPDSGGTSQNIVALNFIIIIIIIIII
jgi:hypothetical protein